MSGFSVWIEAEEWAPGEWDTLDDNSDVVVTLPDGKRWAATFFTFKNIETLREKYRETGECLGGRYFSAAQPVFVEKLTRNEIEAVVADLLETGELASAFIEVQGKPE